MDSAQSDNRKKQTDENDAFLQLGFVLACEYDSFFIIKTKDNSYIQYCPDRWRKMLLKRGEGADFMEAMRNLCDSCVAKEDRADFSSCSAGSICWSPFSGMRPLRRM